MRSHYPEVGSRWRVYDATITVDYAQHGTVKLNRGGKFAVQMSPSEFWKWVDTKNAERVEESSNAK